MDVLLKFLLPHAATLVHSDSECALRDEDVHVLLGNFCLHDISILFAAVVTSVEDPHTVNFNDEHGCPHNVPGNVGRELDSVVFGLDSELDGADAFHAVLDVLVVEKGFLSLDLGSVSDQVLVDVFGGPGHVDLSLVVVLVEEVGKGSTVVEVGVGDDHQLNLGGVDLVKEGKTVGVLLVDHQPAVKHYLFLVDGQDEAGSTHFTPCPQRQN